MVRIKALLDSLACVVALFSLAPVLTYLDRPLQLFALLALPVAFWCDRRKRYPLPPWLATLIAVAGIALYAVQITREDVATPVVHALVVLLSIRLLSPKQGRDYLQIFVLALFILAGSSLIHLEISFILYLVLLVFSVTLGLVILTVFVTDKQLVMPRRDLMKLIKVGLILPSFSLLLMMIFFVVLPRTRHPLWNFLNPTAQATAGLAETVQPGAFSQISAIKKLSFRAEGPELAPEDRYWRALVLNRSEKGRWIRIEPPPERLIRVAGPRSVIFAIYPEPRRDRYLVTLDRPTLVSGIRHYSTVDQMFTARSDLDHPLRFEVRASPGADLLVAADIDRNFYLQTPQQVSTRMRQIAAGITALSPNSEVRLTALADFFREQQLSYAQDDLSAGPDPIDDFLFGKKRGYCEFFASAYVTLARLSGIPARLVGGYYGGEYNSLGDYYLVGEETAHVWTEVLTTDNHWRRIDPSQWAVNVASTLGTRNLAKLSALQQLIDSLNYHWVQAVVIFDLARQMTIFLETGDRLRSLRSVEVSNDWWQKTSLLLGSLFLVWILIRRRKSPEAKLLERFRSRLVKRYGPEVIRPSSGLGEISEQLDNDACREFARIYYDAIFHDRSLTGRELASLKLLLKRL